MDKINNLILILNNQYKLNIDENKIKTFIMAFTHSSYINEHKHLEKNEHYERLEFLGDAVLELATSNYLFNKFSKQTEGNLTKYRASIVCENTLVNCAKKLNFDKFILLGKGEEKIGGRNRAALLADIFESFIGALYLEKGINTVFRFLEQTLFLDFSNNKDNIFKDYKTILQEYVNEKKIGEISYDVMKEKGPSHDKTFESSVYINNKLYGSGEAKTKKESEQLAAYKALTLLNYFKEF